VIAAAPSAPLRLHVPSQVRAELHARRWSVGGRLVALCLVVGVFTHLPSLLRTEVLNPDEALLATQAQVLNDGGQLYQDVVDRKPPVLPVLYAAAFRSTGSHSLWSVRVLALAAHVVTALLLAAIARRRWGDRAAVTAALLYLVASGGLVLEDSQAANFEVFMLPPMVLAFWYAERARPVASGLALAMATMTKQVAAVSGLPLAYLAWRHGGRRGVMRLVVAAGFAVLVSAALFGWSDFWFWVFTGTGGYLDPNGSWPVAFGRGLSSTGIFLAANLAALLLVVAAAKRWREDIDLWLWLATGVIGVAAGLRFFGHYYFQLMPPFVLLAAGAAARARPRVLARTAALGALTASVFVAQGLLVHPRLLHPYDDIAAAIDAHTAPGDTIFVWGQFPQAYWASDRRPASRFLTAGFLTGFSGGRDHALVGEQYAVPGAWEELSTDLVAHPPALIVDTSPIIDTPEPTTVAIQTYPAVNRIVRDQYFEVARVDGAVLYARRVRCPC
jgi:Dolichyl-phosphate-mannose-protein mannosyltransferase